jgi:hypothetical protein
MLRHRLVTAVAAAALVCPAAAAAQQDLRSPDARDASGSARQDLRSPDTRDSAPAPVVVDHAAVVSRDLRSPDARDAATRPSPLDTPVVRVAADAPSTGFEWGDAGIGAVGMLAIVLLIGGVALRVAPGRGRVPLAH